MRVLNDLILDTVTVSASQNSDIQEMVHQWFGDVTAQIVSANPVNKTFVSGVQEVQTLTFPALAAATDGDYIVVSDTSGLTWAVALDKTGGGANTPTGAAWVAIPGARKVYLDISGATTAADVAAAVELGFNALTGFTSVITTNDTAADGTMTLTSVLSGPVTNPVPHNKGDTGAGSIAGVQTTGGVVGDVNITTNQITITAHGFLTGMLFTLTTSSSLPTGLSTSTNYYAIVVDENTIKVASSQVNALAGTAIDLTAYGAGTQTVVVTTTIAGSVKLQKSNEPWSSPTDYATPVWVDIVDSSQNFTSTTALNWALTTIGYTTLRAVVTVTSGTITARIRVNAKGV